MATIPITPLKTPCIRVLPMEILNEISDYEVLCRVLTKINEIIAQMGTWATVEDIKQLQKQIDGFNNTLTWLKDYVDLELKGQNTYIKQWVNETLNTFQKEVNQNINLIYQVIRDSNQEIKTWVENQWKKFLSELPDYTTILVYSPVSGDLVTIQQALDEMWKEIKWDSLTAAEYDALQLTAEQYDNKMLTAYQYDFHGKSLLKRSNIGMMISPFDGRWTTIEDVIYELADLHKEEYALTAAMYDNLGLTAEEYDNKKITAYRYDWEGSLYVK